MSQAFGKYKNYLYAEGTTSGKYSKLVDITSRGAMGSAPSSVDKSTLSDPILLKMSTRPEMPDLSFNYNYNKADFATVSAAIDIYTSHKYMVVLPDNAGFLFSATGSTYVDEAADPTQCVLILTATDSPEFVQDCTTYFETGA